MAQVDFSNATITPLLSGASSDIVTYAYQYLDLYRTSGGAQYADITNSTGTSIASSYTATHIKNTVSEFIIQFSGTFNESGTEFYIKHPYNQQASYQISNISYASGDTFVFQIKGYMV